MRIDRESIHGLIGSLQSVSYLNRVFPDNFSLLSTRGLTLLSVLVFLLAIIGVPIGFYIWGAFWSVAPGLPGGHFTLDGYVRIVSSEDVLQTIYNTVIVVVVGTTISLVLGLATVIAATKTNMPGRNLISYIVIGQYVLPSFILAISWGLLAGQNGFYNTLLMRLQFIDSPPIDLFNVWGISIIGGLAAVLLLATAYLPSRY